jgi:50S ribosomal subunit-associated GTPase HflX
LEDLDLRRIPLLRIFNKADKVEQETADRLCRAFGAISISALNPGTFASLLRAMEEKLFPPPAGLYDQRREAVALSLSPNTRLAICAKN